MECTAHGAHAYSAIEVSRTYQLLTDKWQEVTYNVSLVCDVIPIE